MKSRAPSLLPIFRSRRQAELLALLFLDPGLELTLTDLAARLGTTPGAVHAEVDRLVEAGLIADRFVGRSRLLSASREARVAEPLAALLRVTFGPEAVVREEFGGLAGVERVLIYGSWARRYAGEPGPEPADIDVMVVGRPDRADVYDAAERAADRLGIEVNPTVRSADSWASADDALVVAAARDAVQVWPEEQPDGAAR